jgi:hypothetical protein
MIWGTTGMPGLFSGSSAVSWEGFKRRSRRVEIKGATAASRQGYPPWQVVYNVGFRVVCEE